MLHGALGEDLQELVDCVPNPKSCGGTGGCSGATVELAMSYATWQVDLGLSFPSPSEPRVMAMAFSTALASNLIAMASIRFPKPLTGPWKGS